MIYPAYVNSKKTIQEGRRIAKSKVLFYLYTMMLLYTINASSRELIIQPVLR